MESGDAFTIINIWHNSKIAITIVNMCHNHSQIVNPIVNICLNSQIVSHNSQIAVTMINICHCTRLVPLALLAADELRLCQEKHK